jgi:hypothetical protein
MKGIFENAQQTKTNVLFITWYGGHGEIYGKSTSTQMSLNSPKENERRFSWERELATLSSYTHTYTLAYFDCCRVRVEKKAVSRGPDEIEAEPKTGNLKIIFAC